MTILRISICLICTFALSSSALARVITVSDARVRLGDLSATLPKGLEVVDVGPAPAPGRRARITRAGVKNALVRAGADPSLADSMPAITEVERAAKTVKAVDLRQQIAKSLGPKLPAGVQIAKINSVPDLILPLGPHQVLTKLGPLGSSMSVSVTINSNNERAGHFPVQVLLTGTPQLPVLTKKIARNGIVKKNQVRMQPTTWNQVNAQSALRPEQLIGKKASQPLAAGQGLSHSALKTPPVIARGHEVSVAASGHGIHIVLPATAQEDGMMGQYIRVRPKSGTRTLRAKVVSANEVRISLESFR